MYAWLSYIVYCNAYDFFSIFQSESSVCSTKLKVSNTKVGCCQSFLKGCEFGLQLRMPYSFKRTKSENFSDFFKVFQKTQLIK